MAFRINEERAIAAIDPGLRKPDPHARVIAEDARRFVFPHRDLPVARPAGQFDEEDEAARSELNHEDATYALATLRSQPEVGFR